MQLRDGKTKSKVPVPLPLERAVKEGLGQDTEILQWRLTDEDGVILEQVFIVLWQNGERLGTHRVVVNHELNESACMWGHYFHTHQGMHGQGISAAYKDFNKRVREGT